MICGMCDDEGHERRGAIPKDFSMIPILHRAQEKRPPPGIGVEIDVWWGRDDGGRAAAMVAHDYGHVMIDFDDLLRGDICQSGFRPLYAINCKSDGLEIPVSVAMDTYGVPRDRWFAFDMSYCSQRVFEKAGLPFAERVSEEEPWRGRSHRIWLDRWTWRDNGAAFTGPSLRIRRFPVPIGEGTYLPTFDGKGRKVEVHAVSMELHVADAADHERRNWWRWLFDEVRPASVCTDYPEDLMRTWEEWQRG